jgi:thiol-disulfide isomerase/thioredoxin
MKKFVYITFISIIFLLGCTSKSSKQDFVKSIDSNNNDVDSMLYKPAIISGKILNLEVYPDIKEVKLTIPGFEGDVTVLTTQIKESGQFKLEFYPKTRREVTLYPIEDILVIQPGDSLYILKNFKDIGNSTFSGDGAILNQEISKFRQKYLGRFPTDYQQSYLDFKNSCEKQRTDNYQRLIEFQQENLGSDDFNNWATKQIELDFCKALFHYPFQHFARTKQKLTDSSEYFSFIEKLEGNVDNSIVKADYFTVTEQFVGYQIMNLQEKYRQKIEQKDTIVDLLIDDIFSATENNYLAQFSLGTYLNISLNSNKTDWIDKNNEQIKSKIDDAFIKNNLQEHYDRINEYNKNPKRFSDAILSSDRNIEPNTEILLNQENDNNIVKELIDTNSGKVIYIDFWATWCPPCLHYMKYSKQLIVDFKNKDVEFVFICLNSRADLWKEKLSELKMGGSHIYCNDENTRAIRKRFGFSGIPYYLLINKNGVIVDFGLHLNPQSEYVKQQIEKLLNE